MNRRDFISMCCGAACAPKELIETLAINVATFRYITFENVPIVVDEWKPDPCDCDSEDEAASRECMGCGARNCPHSEPLHYHHDGCPACSYPEDGPDFGFAS